MFLAVDPGETSGVAVFESSGTLRVRFQLTIPQIRRYLLKLVQYPELVYDGIIVEDYRHVPGKQQRGSRFQTVKVIGYLEFFAEAKVCPIHLVSNQAKDMGALYTGEKSPSNHKLSHEVEATNLGVWWLVENGVIDASNLRDLMSEL